ncbi:DUF6194 family protein [Promicromonospora sp. NPDC050880]|uniref:DUF6194 family protein n=1 Tax=Promicromonospora sp. NPDC050880 TaxID=3364406 RepID=UPI0037BBA1FC
MDHSQSTDPTTRRILETVRALDGALVVAPTTGDPDVPELAWGDTFFYYAPDGRMPRNVQPYATIVTKDYPDDTASDLDPAGRLRVNIHVGRTALHELTEPGAAPPDTADVLLPHPVYGSAGWVAVVNPGPSTTDTVLRLLREAHEAARARYERRA